MAMSQEELEQTVLELKDKIDTIVNTAKESEEKWNHDRDLEAFTERNGEALGKYADKLKKLNGDDFDIYSSAFDEYHNDFSDIEEATYVAQLVSEIDKKLAALKEALGDDHVMVESDGDETKVETHDEVIETESEPKEEEKPAEEEETESKEEETESKDDESEEESDPVADFEAELEEEAKKYR